MTGRQGERDGVGADPTEVFAMNFGPESTPGEEFADL